jgi:formylglycine-generating enzyme required for sulfatase activity
VETIPGTVVRFEMLPLPAAAMPGRKPLWIGKTEVTWDVFDIYAFRLDQTEHEKARGVDAQSRPSRPYGAPDRGFGHQGFPALSMTFQAAEQFCRWLSAKTGKKYRLPTEAEWEAASRAGRPDPPPAELDKYAWYWDNAEDKTHPVATKLPNAWGLHDTLGNAAEWCRGNDGKPITCGGSYLDKKDKIGSSVRAAQTPEWNQTDAQNPKSKWWLADATFVGFRIVCEP